MATTQKEVEPTAAIPKRRGRPPGSSSTVPKTSSDNPYKPPLGQVDSSLNESCIAKRVYRRRGAREPLKALTDSRESSSESERSSSDETSEDSDPPEYRKSHSVLPSLELRIEGTKGRSPPKSAPPRIRAPSPWFPPIQEPYVDVFVDGACSYNGTGEPRAGIGVWFGPNNPLNVSRRPEVDKQTMLPKSRRPLGQLKEFRTLE